MNDYGSMFAAHDQKREQRRANADAVAEIVWRYFQPKSVIDLGCGLGFFLAGCATRGAEVQPVDADWVAPLETEVAKESYILHDLNQPFTSATRYDLAASIECAEHLEPHRSRDFVAELCALSDVVLFSAGIPGQGGSGHINLRWQTFWARAFADQGYKCYDPVRRRMAARDDALDWYAQNILLYVKDGTDVPDTLAEHEIAPAAASYVTRRLYSRRIKGFKKKLQDLEAKSANSGHGEAK